MLSETIPSIIFPASVADYTSPPLIISELREQDAAGIISELSHALLRAGFVTDVLPFYHAALNQELMANSAQECGVAFPHGRLSRVKQLQFAFGRAPRPVVWGGRASWPVRFVFLLAVPATDAASYLPLMASLAKLGKDHDVLEALGQAKDPDAILGILRRHQLRQR